MKKTFHLKIWLTDYPVNNAIHLNLYLSDGRFWQFHKFFSKVENRSHFEEKTKKNRSHFEEKTFINFLTLRSMITLKLSHQIYDNP